MKRLHHSRGAETSVRPLPESPECLLPGSHVLTRSGARPVTALTCGDELICGRTGHTAIIQSVRKLQRDLRAVVRLVFGNAVSLLLTASHVIVTRQQVAPAFRPMLATEVRPGDFLRTLLSELRVTQVEHDVLDTAAMEVQLVDTRGSFLVARSNSESHSFVEVCGALAPLDGTSVSILRFQRFDGFRDIITENPELAACREQLEQSGYSVDLASMGLGPAKLFVRPELAWRVVHALALLCRERSMPLRSTEVIVNQEFKPIVLEAVRLRSPRRPNPLVHEEPLELSPPIRTRNTFVDIGSESASSSLRTRSSTDAHLPEVQNPRRRRVNW